MLIKERRKRRLTVRRRLLLGSLPLMLFFLVVLGPNPKETVRQSALRMGWRGFSHTQHEGMSLGLLARTVHNYVNAALRGAELPRVEFDIKFQDVLKLRAKRQEALSIGYLIQGSDDYVPATLKSGGRSMRVRIRLKGDDLDHLESRKWSLRVHVRRGDALLGMRRFSLHHPESRSWQAEFVYLDALRQAGLLAPRYFLVNVTVNGDDVGLMALEEHFSKELLESQARRDGVILKFDEDALWLAQVTRMSSVTDVYFSYKNAAVDAFRKARIEASPELRRAHRVGVGLLRAFVEGHLKPSQVFDADRLGRYLALSDLFAAAHAVVWHNLRFYYDATSGKLEPIGFDASLFHGHADWTVRNEPWVSRALADPAIEAAYRAALRRLAEPSELSRVVSRAQEVESDVLAGLHREFPMLRKFGFDHVARRAGQLPFGPRSEERSEAPSEAPPPSAYPVLAHCYLVERAGTRYLELASAIPRDVEVRAVTVEGDTGSRELMAQDRAPETLPALGPEGEPTRVILETESLEGVKLEQLRVRLGVAGDEATRTVTPRAQWPALRAPPVPEATVEQVVARRPWLVASGESEIRVRPGAWRVASPLVVPAGRTLRIPAGTTLSFAPGTFLVATGPLHFAGTSKDPIRLQGSSAATADGEGWGGVVVLKSRGLSIWSHVHVKDTRGIDTPDWKVPAGVTFVDSSVQLDHCVFDGCRTEDALNTVRTKFALRDVRFANTASDGFDSDFCEGSIDGGSLTAIGATSGGDGLDFSGSDVRIADVRFRNIADKAVSVGEASSVVATRLDIQGVGCGLASKDRSDLSVSDSRIVAARVAALMAYTKKPEFGPATLRATQLRIADSPRTAWVQPQSRLLIDGVPVPAEDLDVEALYQTLMRKATPK